MKSIWARVKAIRSALPERSLDNEELSRQFPDWKVDKIYQKTGIRSRPIAGENEFASDLAVRAGAALFESGACRPDDVDFLLLCTQSPDYFLPTTACLVQHRLGIPTRCGALDFNLGCSGYIYGLSLAKGLIETGQAANVVLLTAETYSKFLHPDDKGVRTIFGDAATATLVQAEAGDRPNLGPFVFGTDGSGGKNLIVRSGAVRQPARQPAPAGEDPLGPNRSDGTLYMNGPEIFAFTLRSVPAAVKSLLAKAETTLENVDYVVFHQANRFMLDALRDAIGIPEAKFRVRMDQLGNTVSNTIPLALEEALAEGSIKPGDRLMLVGFGVGYSWGGCLVRM